MAAKDPEKQAIERRTVLRGGAALVGMTWSAPLVVAAPMVMAAAGSTPPGTTTTTTTNPTGRQTGDSTTTTTTTTTTIGGNNDQPEGPVVESESQTPGSPVQGLGGGPGVPVEVAQRSSGGGGGGLASTGLDVAGQLALAGSAIAVGSQLTRKARRSRARAQADETVERPDERTDEPFTGPDTP